MDKVGKIPKIKSRKHALELILDIAKDKRSHVLTQDCLNWMEVKMKAIRIICNKAISRT